MAPTPTDPNKAEAWITGDPPDQTIDFYIPRGNTGPMGPTGPQGPSLSVGTILTSMGPAAPGTVGPQGLTGPKGDPGGFTSTPITSGQDLDTFQLSGLYTCGDGNFATLALHYPAALKAGILMVLRSHSSLIHQVYYPTDLRGRVTYERTFQSAAWSPWQARASARVDQTAGRCIYQWDDVNGREQMIYGDTGWRAIATDPTFGVDAMGSYFAGANGAALAADAVKIRRIGNRVFIGGNGLLQPKQDYTTSTRNVVGIPTGFRSNGANDFIISRYGNNGGDTGQRLIMLTIPADYAPVNTPMQAVPLIDSNWNGLATGTGWPKTYGGIWIYGSWITNETWPTSLPGSANGTIPNL